MRISSHFTERCFALLPRFFHAPRRGSLSPSSSSSPRIRKPAPKTMSPPRRPHHHAGHHRQPLLHSGHFHLFWRPPVNNGGGEITAYRYRKSESTSAAITPNSDPVDCDNLSAGDWSDSDTYHNVGLHSPTPDPKPSETGHAFDITSPPKRRRWGREVTTDPILAHPAVKCSRESQTNSLFGVCVGNRVLEGAELVQALANTPQPPHCGANL